MQDDARGPLLATKAKVDAIFNSLCEIERFLMKEPGTSLRDATKLWHDILNEYTELSLQYSTLLMELEKSNLQNYAVLPSTIPSDALQLPELLSTKQLPERTMATDDLLEEYKREQDKAGGDYTASLVEEEAKRGAYNELCRTLEENFKENSRHSRPRCALTRDPPPPRVATPATVACSLVGGIELKSMAS